MPAAKPPVTGVVERNIGALLDHRRREDRARSLHERLADGVTLFAGSFAFIHLQFVFFAAWFVINRGWTPLPPFDKSFAMLGVIASVEAIFLSIFVLIRQNRLARLAEKRSELDLQISLLSEHEITQLVQLVARIGQKLGVEGANDPKLDELKRDVAPEHVLAHMEQRNTSYDAPKP